MKETGDEKTSAEYAATAQSLLDAIEQHAWDGGWYRRAFLDDSTPLGSQENDECQIDSLAQSWAVIAGGDESRSRMAFRAAIDRLVLTDQSMVLLFTPPFNHSSLDVGYIKGYLPGVRENGGQYSHAAMWMVQAAATLGDGELALRLFDMLNPIHHSSSQPLAERYRVEPYAVVADIYSNPQHLGRGGWSWYTGAAGWMYRAAIESILGMQISGDQLTFAPRVPAAWYEFRVTLRRGETQWKIHVIRNRPNDTPRPTGIRLEETGDTHEIELGFD
jgi:cyclic beta-1,2-glucan synthetase